MNGYRKVWQSWLAALCLLGAVPAWSQVVLSTVAEVEKVVTDEQGRQRIEYHEAAVVVPGDVVRFTITASNTGSQPATAVVLSNPIPVHMSYLADSAQSSALGTGTTLQFSVDDGKAWGDAAALQVIEDGVRRPATAADYRAVRWQLNFPLAPSEKVRVWYKARLN